MLHSFFVPDNLQSQHTNEKSDNQPLFNPFRDIRLTYNTATNRIADEDDDPETANDVKIVGIDDSDTLYSSHHCVYAPEGGQDSTRFLTRTCRYTNLYYEPQTENFHYFPSPSERETVDFLTLAANMEVSLGHVIRTSTNREQTPPESIWKPEIHNDTQPPEKYAIMSSPSNLVFQLYIPFYSFNMGHLLWDDALALFSMLDTFRLTGLNDDDPDITPLPFYVEMKKVDKYYRCDAANKGLRDRWGLCTKMYNRFFPHIYRYQPHKSGDILRTGNWLR
eukprot:15359187-Ditylum_brightwellii.AAC.1